MANLSSIVPHGAAVRGCVRAIVRALDGLADDDDNRFACAAHELFNSHEHFDDDDMLAVFSLNWNDNQAMASARAYLQRGGKVGIALMCLPEAVSQAEIDASGMSDAEVLRSIAKGDGVRLGLSDGWLSGLNLKLRQHLLCFASERMVDRQGHADLVPALVYAGHALHDHAKYRIEGDTLRGELEAVRAQLAWVKQGLKVVHFGSSTEAAPHVPVYAELLAKFAPGYFKTIVDIVNLPDGSSFDGPVDMHVRAQQAFAYVVERGKFGPDDQITICHDALKNCLTFWECEHFEPKGGCVVSPLYLDFETAAQLAAFCRAITTEASDRSQDLYVRVYQTYFASMDPLKPDQLETWCAHVWPLDDMTIDMYEACANNGDAFC